MPRQALVPIPDLAVSFVNAVEEGRSPYRAWIEEFGLTLEQADKRSWRLRRSGWLPANSYRSEGWLPSARSILDERLEWLAERERAQDERLERRADALRRALEKERIAAAKSALPRQASARKTPTLSKNSVLDLFW